MIVRQSNAAETPDHKPRGMEQVRNDVAYANQREISGAVAEVLAEEHPTRMRFIGMPDAFSVVGPTGKVRAKYGMSAEAIALACRQMVGHR